MRRAAFPLVVAALVACHSADDPAEAPASAESEAPAPEAAGPGSGAEAAAPTSPPAETHPVPVIGPGSRTGPPEGGLNVGTDAPGDVAAPLLLAVETDDPELAEEALRTLSRNLAVWRRRPAPQLVEAVRMFAASSSAPLWRAIDARFAPPAIELLLEIRDMAAVARLTTAFAESAAEPMLRGPRALVARDTTPRAHIEAEHGCTLYVDGAEVDGAVEVLVGSHQAGCGPDDQRLVVLFANERVAIGPDAVRVIEPTADE